MSKNKILHYCRIIAAVMMLWLAINYIGNDYLKYAFFILLLVVMEVDLTVDLKKHLSFKNAVISVGLFLVINILINKIYPVTNVPSTLTVSSVISAIIFAPICEEIFFRKALNDGVNDIIGAILSSLAFGAFHGEVMFIPATLSGLALYLIYRLTGSLKASILAHMANNTLAIMFHPDTIAFFRNLIG